MTARLAVEHLTCRFGARDVVRDVSLEIAAGEVVCLLGPSGCGKSTTLRAIAGIEELRAGRITLDERVLAEDGLHLPPEERSIGLIFQDFALFPHLSVWENIAFRLLNADGMKRKDAKERAIDTLRQVRLGSDVADLTPAEISGGMQKRVGLARAIVSKPELIFFDEPTTGLDPITADAINDLIVEQTKALGAAAISITHDMASARKIADEIAILFEGKIIWRGPASQIDTSGNDHVDQFVHGRAEGPIQPAL